MEEGLEEDFLKAMDEIDWNKDWNETEELCGSDSLYCIKQSDISDNKGTSLVPGTSTTQFTKHVDDSLICEMISERIPRNTHYVLSEIQYSWYISSRKIFPVFTNLRIYANI